MDKLKAAVAKAVSEYLNDEKFPDEVFATIDGGGFSTVEVHDISPTITSVRVCTNAGPPRYFIVKVSEQM